MTTAATTFRTSCPYCSRPITVRDELIVRHMSKRGWCRATGAVYADAQAAFDKARADALARHRGSNA